MMFECRVRAREDVSREWSTFRVGKPSSTTLWAYSRKNEAVMVDCNPGAVNAIVSLKWYLPKQVGKVSKEEMVKPTLKQAL
jgi:adenosyl cobinamide kinase/adenosyl cobinamide phosphate guanylyltransferase